MIRIGSHLEDKNNLPDDIISFTALNNRKLNNCPLLGLLRDVIIGL